MAATSAGLGTVYNTGAAQFMTSLVTDDYTNRLNDARNNAAALLGLIPEASDRVSGKFIVEPVMFGRNGEAFGYTNRGGKLPDPRTTKALVYAYKTRPFFARLIFSGDVFRATNKDDVRFIGVIERDFDAMANDMAVDLNRILHNDGSGRLAEVQSAATPQVTLRLNSNWESVSTCTSSPVNRWEVGMRVGIFSNAGVHRGTRAVLSIDSETLGPPSSAVVTLGNVDGVSAQALPGGVVPGDWICKINVVDQADGTGGFTNSGYRAEMMGLAGLYSDNGVLDGHGAAVLNAGTSSYLGTEDFTTTAADNFQGIPVAGNPFNRAIVMAGGGGLRPLTEGLLQLSASKVEKQNNGKIDMMLSNYGVRDGYGIPLLGQKQYHNTTELRGGWSVLDWNGKPWYVDRDCPENRLYLMGLEAGGFVQHINTPFQPLDYMGAHWYRLQDEDKYQAAWVMENNVGVGIRERIGGIVTDLNSLNAA